MTHITALVDRSNIQALHTPVFQMMPSQTFGSRIETTSTKSGMDGDAEAGQHQFMALMSTSMERGIEIK